MWYEATGSVTFHHLVFEELGCTVTPLDFLIRPNVPGDNNRLLLDYSFTPAKYGGSGDLVTQLTVTCPNSPSMQVPVTIPWFSGAGDLSADGASFGGSSTTSAGTSSYEFHAQ